MISAQELNPLEYELSTEEFRVNFKNLYLAMNAVRDKYGKLMIVTSGFRSEADQARINPKCPHDAHTQAAACDIEDKDGELWAWCLNNLSFLEGLGIHLEAKTYTPAWVHFQVIPPKSGKSIFIP